MFAKVNIHINDWLQNISMQAFEKELAGSLSFFAIKNEYMALVTVMYFQLL